MSYELEFLARQLEELDLLVEKKPDNIIIGSDAAQRHREQQAQIREKIARLQDVIHSRRRELDIEHFSNKVRAGGAERVFWFRRYLTTLAIANGAAFVTLANGYLQAKDRHLTALLVADPLTLFGIGGMMAGLVPICLWLKAERARKEASWIRQALSERREPNRAKIARFKQRKRLISLIGGILGLGSTIAFAFGVMVAIGLIRGSA